MQYPKLAVAKITGEMKHAKLLRSNIDLCNFANHFGLFDLHNNHVICSTMSGPTNMSLEQAVKLHFEGLEIDVNFYAAKEISDFDSALRQAAEEVAKLSKTLPKLLLLYGWATSNRSKSVDIYYYAGSTHGDPLKAKYNVCGVPGTFTFSNADELWLYLGFAGFTCPEIEVITDRFTEEQETRTNWHIACKENSKGEVE